MNAGKLAPPELRTLLGLLAELAELLPSAADYSGWKCRDDVERDRYALLRSRLTLLNDQLALCALFPSNAEEDLADFCKRSAEGIRAELAKPLGYEPAPDKASR